MKDPNDKSDQPKDGVADALTDRNSDPDAEARDEPLKYHGDALLHGSDSRREETPSTNGKIPRS